MIQGGGREEQATMAADTSLSLEAASAMMVHTKFTEISTAMIFMVLTSILQKIVVCRARKISTAGNTGPPPSY